MHVPIQDDAHRQEGRFLNRKIRGEAVRVPTKKDAIPDGFDIHMGTSNRGVVISGVFNDFFVESPILTPARDYVELREIERKLGDVKIALDKFG